MRNYVDVTDADFERAATSAESVDPKAAQKEAQQPRSEERSESHAAITAHEKSPDSQGSATSCETPRIRGMEAAGIEYESYSCDTSDSSVATWTANMKTRLSFRPLPKT